MKLTIDTENIATIGLGSSAVHYRIVTDRDTGEAVSVCVQGFDYSGYGKRFVTEICFAHEVDADKASRKINKVGVKHFV